MSAEGSVKYKVERPPVVPVLSHHIPELLKAKAQWVMWNWVWDGAKWDKPPHHRAGYTSDAHDPKSWSTFDEAIAALPRFDGLGFAMRDTKLIGIDLDDCRNPDTGEITPFALKLVEDLGTYAEVSPSREGIKLWVEGDMPAGSWMNKNAHLGIEVYTDKRYFTITGHVVEGAKPIAKTNKAFETLMVNYMQRSQSSKSPTERPKDLAYEIELAKEAIQSIDPDCDYTTWINIGMSLNWLSDTLFYVWDEWSTKSLKYPGEDKLLNHWKSFSGIDSRIHIATLFWHATKAGWERPGAEYENSDYGVARRVRDRAEDRMFFVHEWGKWIAWDGKSFSEDRSNKLAEMVVATSKAMMADMPETTGNAKDDEKAAGAWKSFCMHYQSGRAIRDVEKLCRGLMHVEYKQLDRDRMRFHCANGVYNLHEHKFEPHSHEHLNTQVSPVVYDSLATCPRWDQFMVEVTNGDTALSEYLQKIFGYCLSGSVEHQAIFTIKGNGRNGKGVFTRALLKLLGQYAGPVSQDLLMAAPNQHPTQFAYLYGKRCVVAQETDQDVRLNENQVKNLTGGDPIQARRMREDFWEFDPTHKIFLATNYLPLVRGSDNGIWRRIKTIPFNVTFGTAELPLDSKLDEKIERELSGILNWAINGWAYLQMEKELVDPPAVLEAQKSYREEMNIVQQFVVDKCERGPDYTCPAAKLYQAFKLYCEDHGLHIASARKFSNDLENLGVTATRDMHTRLKAGIALRTDLADAGVEAESEPVF